MNGPIFFYVSTSSHTACELSEVNLTCWCTKHIKIHSHTVCLCPPHSLWYGVFTYLFSLPVFLSVTCLLFARNWFIYWSFIHSVCQSVTQPPTRLSVPLYPSLSSSVASLVFASLPLSPRNLARTNVRSQIVEQPPERRRVYATLMDKQSSAAEEWRRW